MYSTASEIIREYQDVFQGVGKVPIEVSLKVDQNHVPVSHAARPVPAALQDKVKDKLHELVSQDIEKIPIDSPTPWCSPMHVVPKQGQAKLTIDPNDLNKALLRELHPMPTMEEIAQ